MKHIDSTELIVRAPESAPRSSQRNVEDVPAVGHVIKGRYRVLRPIGTGAMGSVFAVEDIRSGQTFAAKILHNKANDPNALRRFLREAVAASSLHCPHAVRIHEVGRLQQSGTQFMIMELLEGEDLAQRLERGPMSPKDVAAMALQLCEVLMESHALGIVHRDIKPSNIFLMRKLDGGFFVKLLDFGISRFVTSPSDLTRTSTVVGSPLYMSPEQMRSSRRADARSDIWSLGVVLYEAITGEAPFTADTLAGLSLAIATDEPKHLGCPEPLASAIMRCLRKKPKDRFQSVLALRAAISPGSRHQQRVRRGVAPAVAVRIAFGGACVAAAGLALWLAVTNRSLSSTVVALPTSPAPAPAALQPSASNPTTIVLEGAPSESPSATTPTGLVPPLSSSGNPGPKSSGPGFSAFSVKLAPTPLKFAR